MGWFAEAKLLVEQGDKRHALTILEVLTLPFPKQLALPGLVNNQQELPALQGMILGDLDRGDARPFLQTADPPETWRGITEYYLGRCLYEVREYLSAERKLKEALEIGLPRQWEPRTHYVLGITEYRLSKMQDARHHFEHYAKTANPEDLVHLGFGNGWRRQPVPRTLMLMPILVPKD
jgi:tetratricopeptide (TPR) repeat protein